MTPDELAPLKSALTDRQPLPLTPTASNAASAAELYEMILELRSFTAGLVAGDLSLSLHHKGYLAGTLKSLQANLRHLTWQAQQISEGDFTQRIDFMLEKTASLLRQSVRPSDTAGRYGGEEFMLILPNTDRSGARGLAERVRSLIETAPFIESDLKVTISAGIATWDEQKRVDLIQTADSCLYDAKSNGRNRIEG